MDSVKIKIANSQEFNRALENYAKSAQMSFSEAVEITAQELRNEAISILGTQKVTDTGRLKQSLTIRRPSAQTRQVGTETGYGLYIEFGRPPGSMPPKEAIDRWARRKLKLSPKDAARASFFIRKKIMREGTKAKPFLRPAFERTKKRLFIHLKSQLAK